MNKKAIMIGLLAVYLASAVFALGVVPSSKEITFEPNSVQEIQLKIKNNNGENFKAVLYADGPLADCIEFSESEIEFSTRDEYKITSYILNLPDELSRQGIISTDIIIRALASTKDSSGSQLSAQLSVVSTLKVAVPYSGKYVDTKLFAPHFKKGLDSNFALQVKNLGTDNIKEAYVEIKIYGSGDELVETLTTKPVPIDSKTEKIISIPWSPAVGSGNYRAVATLFYDGLNKVQEQEFQIGTLNVDILSISVKDFKLGGIARFDMLIQSNWNEPLSNVYGDVTILSNKGNPITTYKTASLDLDAFSIGELLAFWDTKEAGVGQYKLRSTINYVGQSTSREFDITVLMDKIETSATAAVISGSQVEETPGSIGDIVKSIYLLIFLVVILIGFNAYIFLKRVRPPQQPQAPVQRSTQQLPVQRSEEPQAQQVVPQVAPTQPLVDQGVEKRVDETYKQNNT